MTASAASPPVSPGAPLALADHDLVARIARVWVLQHRPVRNRRELDVLVDDLDAWQTRTRDLLVRRFGDERLVARFDAAAGPLVEPEEAGPLRQQVAMVRRQADARMTWLSELRETLAEHLPTTGSTPGARASVMHHHPDGAAVVVLCPAATSPTASSVSTALEALGDGQPTIVELSEDLAGIEHAVPLGAAAVVIVERESRSTHPATQSVLALGWAVGALGRDRVLAVLGPMVEDHPALDSFMVVPAKVRARWRAEVVAWAAAATRPD
jgi:hypothetical protein